MGKEASVTMGSNWAGISHHRKEQLSPHPLPLFALFSAAEKKKKKKNDHHMRRRHEERRGRRGVACCSSNHQICTSCEVGHKEEGVPENSFWYLVRMEKDAYLEVFPSSAPVLISPHNFMNGEGREQGRGCLDRECPQIFADRKKSVVEEGNGWRD